MKSLKHYIFAGFWRFPSFFAFVPATALSFPTIIIPTTAKPKWSTFFFIE